MAMAMADCCSGVICHGKAINRPQFLKAALQFFSLHAHISTFGPSLIKMDVIPAGNIGYLKRLMRFD